MRVVALTADAALAVAISMIDGWEIVEATDIQDAIRSSFNANVLLVGVGGTEEGVAVMEQILAGGADVPGVVVGDVVDPESLFPVVTRPFSLEDIRDAVDGVALPPEPVAHPAPAAAPVIDVAPVSPPPPPVASPPAPSKKTKPAPPKKARPPVEKPVSVQKERPAPKPQEPKEKKKRRRRASPPPVTVAAKLPPEVRMKAAIIAAGEIRNLLDEMPFLADRAILSAVLLDEAVAMLSPAAGTVMVRAGNTFEVVAGYELSRAELSLVIPADHALVVEIGTSLEALFIAPVDLARGMVVGIPGTRFDALLAAPIILNGVVEGMIVVCGDAFTEAQLEELDDLASEAEAGFAVAAALTRLLG